MNFQDILKTVQTSVWQPTFTNVDDVRIAADSILRPHEDYCLAMHDVVVNIIEREVAFAKTQEVYNINIRDVFSIQKELFDQKIKKVQETNSWHLPSLYISLGVRKITVKLPNTTPPAPIYIPDLLKNIFPITVENGVFKTSTTTNLVEWFKIFQTIHPLDDLNGRVGGIILNILSKLTKNTFVVNSNYKK